MSISKIVEPKDMQAELEKMLMSGNQIPLVSVFDTVKIYDNKSQADVAHDIISFLNNITTRQENTYDSKDAMRGALVACAKFAIQTYYENNKRQFTKEHKQKILEDISKIMDTQLSSMCLQQVLAH